MHFGNSARTRPSQSYLRSRLGFLYKSPSPLTLTNFCSGPPKRKVAEKASFCFWLLCFLHSCLASLC
ncbi:hypothetical protein MRB53_034483 [Persea americana]|uniref:Uncharacterized protein n=1 Tax=Persea americana TaxID=3435 RepID=A0ACC2K203_PERAE|nr:hypothetical protein MRB53_034483 [Persea americana]